MSDSVVRPDVRAFLDLLSGTPLAALETLGAETARALMRQVRQSRPAAPLPAVVRDLICAGPAGPIGCRLYDSRTDRAPGPVILYFHGGGFVLGDLDSHQPLCIEIALQMDLPVLSVDYRLAPEHPWPAAPDDSECVARWIGTPAASLLGLDCTAMILAGDSAGANLAAVTANALARRPAAVPVIAQFLIYPTTGGSGHTDSRQLFSEGYFLTGPAMDWFEACYAARTGDPRHDLNAGALVAMPPTLLVTAGLDPLRDEGRAYAAALIAAGVDVVYQEARGNIHGCFSMAAAIPSSTADITRALSALRMMCSNA